jgi:hypothetical protein
LYPKITIKLQGGLGNQLFQYATGRALSIATGANLVLDLYHLCSTQVYTRMETPRAYALHPYTIRAELLQPADNLLHAILPARIKRYLWANVHFRKYACSFGEDFFVPDISTRHTEQRTVLLDGFFQNEKYFSHIRHELLEELQLQEALPPVYRKWIAQATAPNSVAVHIRRGDYVLNPSSSVFHGVLPESYYREAFSLIRQKLDNPTYFFFSDDIDWVAGTFGDIPGCIFVKSSVSTPHLDLELMRLCRHQVIANSSFSWWGAWLNQFNDKIVIGPKKWLAEPAENAKIILPKTWLRI